MTERKRLVQSFFPKLSNETMKLLRSQQTSTSFGKLFFIIGSEKWYAFDYFLKIVLIIVQSGLKLNDITTLAAGVDMHEQVCNPFAQRSHKSN